MVIGMAGVGWFFAGAHADITVVNQANGQITLTGPPGVGYRYKWTIISLPGKEKDAKVAEPVSSDGREVSVTLTPGDHKEAVLEVENVFKNKATDRLPLNLAAPTSIISVPGAGTPNLPAGATPRPAPGGAR
jgi:hypothetical protein